MNETLTKKMANHYEGNGWSRYQVMVLQQLDDHNKVLQNLNKELVDLKQSIAVSETELKMWRAQIMANVNKLDEHVDQILYNDNSLSSRVAKLERDITVDKEATTKVKAIWAFYGAIFMFIIDIGVKLFAAFWK